MRIHNAEILLPTIKRDRYFLKCLINATDAVFFSGTALHRNVKMAGVSYEEDSQGNAIAVTIADGIIDVRWHDKFTDSTVTAIFCELLADPQMAPIAGFKIRYQGRISII